MMLTNRKIDCVVDHFKLPFLCGVALMAGCIEFNFSPLNRSPTICRDVHGTIRLDDQPLANANVIFVPMQFDLSEPKLNPLSFAVTDNSGKYRLAITETESGAIVGGHYVLISARKQSSGLPADTDEPDKISIQPELKNKLTQILTADEMRQISKADLSGEVVPPKYNLNSRLTAKINNGDSEEINFKLSSE